MKARATTFVIVGIVSVACGLLYNDLFGDSLNALRAACALFLLVNSVLLFGIFFLLRDVRRLQKEGQDLVRYLKVGARALEKWENDHGIAIDPNAAADRAAAEGQAGLPGAAVRPVG
jgi:hypothetical protein